MKCISEKYGLREPYKGKTIKAPTMDPWGTPHKKKKQIMRESSQIYRKKSYSLGNNQCSAVPWIPTFKMFKKNIMVNGINSISRSDPTESHKSLNPEQARYHL